MYSVLVTGGLGFIGSYLVDELLSMNHEVSIIDNLSSNVLPNGHYGSAVDTYIGDISDNAFVESACANNKYDYIFHLAAKSSVAESVEDDKTNFSSNVIGTYNILKHAIKMDSKLILASSCAVYGAHPQIKVSEDDTTMPVSPYGLSKLVGENMCSSYSRIYGIDTISMRIFNAYGHRQHRSVIYDFLRKFQQVQESNAEIGMLGSGNEIKDFIHVKDVLKAMLLPLRNEKMWGGVYNVGTGKGTKIRELLFSILNVLSSHRDISYSGYSWRGDIIAIFAEIDKIKSYGFTPTVDLESGLKDISQMIDRNFSK